MNGVSRIIGTNKLGEVVGLSGHPSWSFLTFKDQKLFSGLELKTLFIQEVFRRGVYTLGSHNVSYAHSMTDVDELLGCYMDVFALISTALSEGAVLEHLKCSPLVPLFKVR